LTEAERELRQARATLREQRQTIARQREELKVLQASSLQHEVERLSAGLAAQQALLTQTYEAMRKQDQDLVDWRDSGAVRLAYALQRGTSVIAPPGTARQRGLRRAIVTGRATVRSGRRLVRRVLSRYGQDTSRRRGVDVQTQYDQWRRLHDPLPADLERMRSDNRLWSRRPLVSVLLPTYNPEAAWIREAVGSVSEQAYENWELCVADDASTASHVVPLLAGYAASDPRIKLIVRETNGGIVEASATALSMARGEFVALLDHDDVLRPHALHRMVEQLQVEPETDVLYSDEDLLFADGMRGGPHFKPDWSPDLLLSVNYMCHLLVARRELVERVGGFRPGFDGAQDHDLALRLTEHAGRVGHVADVLYSWRRAPGSVAAAPTAKMYSYDAGRRAVEEALTRRGVTATVSLGEQLGTYHSRRAVDGQPEVAIIIPTRDRVDMLRDCISSIETLSTYGNWSLTVIDNGSVESETVDFLATMRHTVVRRPGPFNYSALMNQGRSQVDAPFLLMLNNDVVTTTPDWIEALLEHAQRPEVGAVGARLVYPGGAIQHEGIGLGNICEASTAVNLDAGWQGRIVRDVSAVTGACQMVPTSVFDEVGGYDEGLPVAYNDVDFCLRVRATGRLVVYTPHAELCHREGASRGRLHHDADEELFWMRWGQAGGIRDPYISPHLRGLHPLELRLGPLRTDR
jgi:O-antigen biosynthesis protein